MKGSDSIRQHPASEIEGIVAQATNLRFRGETSKSPTRIHLNEPLLLGPRSSVAVTNRNNRLL